MAKKRTSAASRARRPKPRGTRRTGAKPTLPKARGETPATPLLPHQLSSAAPMVVAVLNSNQDVLRLIRSTLEDEGYTVATEHIVSFKDRTANLAQFLLNHRPAVLVYDLAPPYKENWNFLQLLCRIPAIAAVPMVLTTVNKSALEGIVGKTEAFEILGTRDSLAPLVDAINRSVRSRR